MNSNDFDHYPASLDKMNKIHKFFNNFFIFNTIKDIANLLWTAANINLYTVETIDLYAFFVLLNTAIPFFTMYEKNYIKTPMKCFKATFGFILSELLILFLKPELSIFSIITLILSALALSKYLKIDELSKLKGFPIFSELLDNPQVYQIKKAPAISTPIPSIVSIPIPSIISNPHISVKLPEPEPLDIERRFSKNEESILILPQDIPPEARLLGNATMDFKKQIQVEDMFTPKQKNKKKINLSKEKKIELEEL